MSFKGRVDVPFIGLTSRVGPLCWGQRWMWNVIDSLGPNQHINPSFVLDVENGCTIPDILSAIRLTLDRHEALRTIFPRDSRGERYQEVIGEGSLSFRVVEAAMDDPHRVATRELEATSHPPFMDTELPIRAAVVVEQEEPRYLIIIVSHAVADAVGNELIRNCLESYIHSFALGEPPIMNLPPLQPVDCAAFEQSDRGAAKSGRALRYWHDQLLSFPATMFPWKAIDSGNPRFSQAFFESEAIGQSARLLANRFNVSPTAVVIAAFAIPLSVKAELSGCAFTTFVGNRHESLLKEVVGTFVQYVPIFIETAGMEFPAICQAAFQSLVRALRYGRYDPDGLVKVINAANSNRDDDVDMSGIVVANVHGVVSGDPDLRIGDRLDELLSKSAIRCEECPSESSRLSIEFYELSRKARFRVRADGAIFSTVELSDFLLGIERSLVGLASEYCLTSAPAEDPF